MVHPIAMQDISAQFYGTPLTTQRISVHSSTRPSYRCHVATDVFISPAGLPGVLLLGEDDFKEARGFLNWYLGVKIRCISDNFDDANLTENFSSFQIFTVYSDKSWSFQDSDHNSPVFQPLTYSLYRLKTLGSE